MRISDWSSDVCSSDLTYVFMTHVCSLSWQALITHRVASRPLSCVLTGKRPVRISLRPCLQQAAGQRRRGPYLQCAGRHLHRCSSNIGRRGSRSEEHTYELQSLMRNPYAVFCLKNK